MKRNVNEEINKIKKVMGLLTEEMQLINDHKFINDVDSIYTVIAKDELNDDYHFLVLLIRLVPISDLNTNDSYEYNYSFIIYDKNSNLKTKNIYKRSDAINYLPSNSKGKIMPIVIEMTKNLINRIKPKVIFRQVMENLEGNSLKRYEKITNVLINELGYTLQSEAPNPQGIHTWKFVRNGENLELDENTIIDYNNHSLEFYTWRCEKHFEKYFKDKKLKLD